MKKLSTYLFLILFSFSAPSFADDIRDFQIEGISIGDSLLKHLSKKEILSNHEFIYYNEKSFSKDIAGIFYDKDLSEYDIVQIDFKFNDPDFTIVGMSGYIDYDNDLSSCYKKQNEIDNKMSSKYSYIKRKDWGILKLDIGGEGATYRPITYDLKKGSRMAVDCYFYTDPTFTHNLKVHMSTKIMKNYMNLPVEPSEN